MKTMMMLGAVLTLLAGAVCAQESSGLKGSASPAFSATRLLNAPADGQLSMDDCKGEVVLVKLWGVKCGPCIGSMPEVQSLWNKYEGKGLHIFMLERQGHSESEIKQLYKEMNLSFPQVIEGDFGGFRGVGSIPYAYVIGVDGKVIFEGHSGYTGEIDKEIKKVRYLGLGKNEVAKEVEKAAQLLSAGEYAKALDEARKVKEKKGEDQAVATDADLIVARVEGKVANMRKSIDSAKESRRYHEAVAMLTVLSGRAFKGMEAADKAATELKEMKTDKAIKDELSAWAALTTLLESIKKSKDAARKAELENFANRNTGKAAAEEAMKLAGEIADSK
jgi:thiol-disulfide isomerase/thioredoxin